MTQLTVEQENELVGHVVALSRSTIRVVVGDSTPRQYDRADAMADGIARAVRGALVRTGLRPEEE